MKVTKVTKLKDKHTQYDISTGTENFYVKTNSGYVLIHNSPAVFCGIDPADGKFFVGTKGVFAKDPKLVKNSADLKRWYGDKPELAAKLEAALKHLPKLGIKGVLQGDMMFTPADLKAEDIGGEQHITFTPNTITYAVPADSDIAAEIKAAKIGIVFHTSYTGETLETMSASFGFSANELTPNKDVWMRDALYRDMSGVATLTEREEQQIKYSMQAVENVVDKLGNSRLDVVLKHPDFVPALKIFMNQRVRSGSSVGEPIMFLKDFLAFFKERMQKEIEKLKGGPDSPAGKKRTARAKEIEDFVGDNMNALLGVMAIYKHLIQAKLVLLRKLQTINTIGTFMRTENGYEVTSPEGFVAIGHDGEAVKLVDRLEFSMQNFNSVKDWGTK